MSIALVQQANADNLGNNATTMTLTLGSSPSSSNVLVLFFGQPGAAQTITSITGATWTQIGADYTVSIGDHQIWVGTSPSSTTITITGTNYFGTFQQGFMMVAEFSGLGSTLDSTPAYTTSGTWAVTTGSVTTTNANDLVVTSVVTFSGGGAAATVSSPWTLLTATSGTFSLAAAYQIVTSTGAYSAVWNGGGTPQASTIVLALKAAGGVLYTKSLTASTATMAGGTPKKSTRFLTAS